MLTKFQNNLCNAPWFRNAPNLMSYSFGSATLFHGVKGNLVSFSVILLTDKRTDRQTDKPNWAHLFGRAVKAFIFRTKLFLNKLLKGKSAQAFDLFNIHNHKEDILTCVFIMKSGSTCTVAYYYACLKDFFCLHQIKTTYVSIAALQVIRQCLYVFVCVCVPWCVAWPAVYRPRSSACKFSSYNETVK